MAGLSYKKFLNTLPEQVVHQLPSGLKGIQVKQPWQWLVQFHFGEPRLHYEVSRPRGVEGWELGLHCEAKDKDLNRYLLNGFRRHLFEIKDALGPSIEAEMWDKGWAKIYEVYPPEDLTEDYQAALGGRLAEIITCFQPIFTELRNDVSRVYR